MEPIHKGRFVNTWIVTGRSTGFAVHRNRSTLVRWIDNTDVGRMAWALPSYMRGWVAGGPGPKERFSISTEDLGSEASKLWEYASWIPCPRRYLPAYGFDVDLQWKHLLQAALSRRMGGTVMADNLRILGSEGDATVVLDQVAAHLGWGRYFEEDPLHYLDRALFESTVDAIVDTVEWREIVSVTKDDANDLIILVALRPPTAQPGSLAGAVGVSGFAYKSSEDVWFQWQTRWQTDSACPTTTPFSGTPGGPKTPRRALAGWASGRASGTRAGTPATRCTRPWSTT